MEVRYGSFRIYGYTIEDWTFWIIVTLKDYLVTSYFSWRVGQLLYSCPPPLNFGALYIWTFTLWLEVLYWHLFLYLIPESFSNI